jgi:hypothetical protein
MSKLDVRINVYSISYTCYTWFMHPLHMVSIHMGKSQNVSSLKNMSSSLGMIIPIYCGKTKNVPNHHLYSIFIGRVARGSC